MGSKSWLYLVPTYRTIETFWVTDENAPSPHCGHTFTVVATTKTQGPHVILFGGAIAIEGGSSSAPGGIGPGGHSIDDLYVLNLINDKYK
ncbi:Serine/threonine-protein phosphatase BSL1 [Glycine soja]|uniref:Serine/threonine-protein phosphatase BSL1 n=1 Tax=Glycine soja TaxID=3848 RepID=A0A0B2STS7_GLYSO|nr:Serine/threonine-protein phosphatase BSL1 [Glycine soja]